MKVVQVLLFAGKLFFFITILCLFQNYHNFDKEN